MFPVRLKFLSSLSLCRRGRAEGRLQGKTHLFCCLRCLLQPLDLQELQFLNLARLLLELLQVLLLHLLHVLLELELLLLQFLLLA